MQYRLDAAYDYLVKNPNTVCIVSGGQGVNEPMTEAEGMYTYLVKRGIAPERIRLEDQSTDTTENIRNSSTFFDPAEDTVGIVTNNFHLYRGMYLARKQGIKHVYGISAGALLFYLPNNMLREFFCVVRDVIM